MMKIKEDMFPEIIEQYNQGGRTAAYDLLRSRYGIKQPYFVIKRIMGCEMYAYDPNTDRFSYTGESTADDVFIDLDELCSTTVNANPRSPGYKPDSRPEAMERLIQELISDRLLTLSRYVTIDSSTRTILIDQTSLSADGYQLITH